jgi:O-antigen/teichoic acid export membrane protein
MNDTKKLFSNSFIIFVGTIVGSFFAYLYNMLMGRMLGPNFYGELTSIFSLLAIIGVAGTAILTISMRYSSELYNQKQTRALNRLYKFLTRNVVYLSLLLFVLGVFLSNPIAKFLSLPQTWPVILAFVCMIFSLLTTINRGFLQGTQKFVTLSFLSVIEMGARLLLGILLVYFGFKLFGAISAVVIASVSIYIISLFPIKKIIKINPVETGAGFKFDKKEILNYAWPTLIASLLLAVSINVDIIMVKHFFDPETAGLYAAISTIAKIILYISAPIVSVMFPMISEKKVKGDRHYKLFLSSLLFTLLCGLVILAFYNIMPGKIIALLYGTEFTSFYSYLPEAGLFVLFYALANLIVNYYLVVKDFTFLYFYGLVLVLQIVSIFIWHGSITIIIRDLIATNGLLFLLLIGYYLITKRVLIRQFLKGEYES